MPDLDFKVESAEADLGAAVPRINFKLRVTHADAEREPDVSIRGITLRAAIRIEPTRRRYLPESQPRLRDLFGAPELWSKSVRAMPWIDANLDVPPFAGSALVDLPVPCTFDFNIAATKYFHGLDDGDVPLSITFSGTIFYLAADGRMQIGRVAWDKEASFKLPVAVWRDMMDHYYAQSAWLCLRRDLFDRLLEHKSRLGLSTWEQAIESLLGLEEPATP